MKRIDRRRFLSAAGRGAVVATAALAGACDLVDNGPEPRKSFVKDALSKGFGDDWLNVRYEGPLDVSHGRASISVLSAEKRAIEDDARQTEYMARPVVFTGMEAADVEVECGVHAVGRCEAGVVACWSHDEAYALLIREKDLLLCRYGIKDRIVFDRRPLPRNKGPLLLHLSVAGGRVHGTVESDGGAVSLSGTDADPLAAGLVGVVVNPIDVEKGGRGEFFDFKAAARDPHPPTPAFIYRFAGGVVTGESKIEAHLTARTVLPVQVGFEIATDAGFDEVVADTELASPEGKWGAVHAWARGLEPGKLHHWRPYTFEKKEKRNGRTGTFMTPSPNRALRFAFGSCTSGRTTNYNSFHTAAARDPEFYLHGGDFGYANLNSVEHSPDHFQARWSRLVRVPEMTELLDKTPLMFWQDDHDYQADNGWAKTCKPYTIWSFDEFHANPTDRYFDVRWGDVHVWCLDCRLYASDPELPDDANKSRIGAEQKAWLKKGMSESDAPVRVVAAAMVFRNKVNDDKGWHNVYTTERDELLGFFASIRDEQNATVFILSGDSHGHRLIHHYEFGELYEITASGTDFPKDAHWWQGNHDPKHTLISIDGRTGFALVDLDPPGPNRTVTIRSIASKDGETMFLKVLPVAD